jgi:hypothetical protein
MVARSMTSTTAVESSRVRSVREPVTTISSIGS